MCPIFWVAFCKIWLFWLGHFRRFTVLRVFVPFFPQTYVFISFLASSFVSLAVVIFLIRVFFLIISHCPMHIVFIALPFSSLFLLYRHICTVFFLSYYTCLFGFFVSLRFLIFFIFYFYLARFLEAVTSLFLLWK